MRARTAAANDLDAVVARVARLEVLFEAFARQSRGPRDQHELAVVDALARLLADVESFGAAAVLDLGRHDHAFKALLDAADLRDVAGVGYILRHCRGRTFHGLTLIRVGRRWAFAHMYVPCADGRTIETCRHEPSKS